MARGKTPASKNGNVPAGSRSHGGAPRQTEQRQSRQAVSPHPCFIVAIGASAGGQEALEQLFTVMPPDCGLSFMVVMHLPPHGPSFLAEMLGRYTTMEVVTAEEGMPLLPNRVQVIPAGRDLTLHEGRLHLEEPDGTHHPIDRLFRSLAADPSLKSVAVVLSGSGTDGAAGARAIKEAGGTVLVQEPGLALYPGMPDSVIAAGAADLVLPAEDIPISVAEIARGTCSLTPPDCQPASLDEELQTIFRIIKERTGHDFSSYKANTVVRRIERRMAVHEMGGLGKYVTLLQKNPQEAHVLGQDILIGVTSFFRDPEAFEALRQKVIPQLFGGSGSGDPVRVWHACCATGEEVYSMAILVREFLEDQRLDARVQLFATDIDEASIAQARAGLYSADIEGEVGEERLRNFFALTDGRHYQVAKRLREMVIFAHHSLVKDPPFSRLDLIVCRNFLIYLNTDMQKRLISLFHQVLKPGGFLFLGSSETVGRHSDLFVPIDKKWKIYQRQETGRRTEVMFPFAAKVPRLPGGVRPVRLGGTSMPVPGSYAEKFLVERYAPPCVVVNEQYEVVYFSTRTSRFLEPPVGEPTLDIIRMARQELRPSLRAAIHKAFADQKQVVFRGVKVSSEGDEGTVTIQVEPIGGPLQAGRLATVVFEPTPAFVAAPPRPTGENGLTGGETSQDTLVHLLEENLRIAQEQLQAAIEQLETSNEGFMSTNEELITINEEYQATNEELQATNEELETSKEELQALNEELATVNVELQGMVEEAKQANADLENLLASSEIATIFLDRRLKIKRFSPAMARIFNLIPADIGRPFRHLKGTIDWPDLSGDAATVLDTLLPMEREVSALNDGRHYLMRLLPYLAAEKQVDGVVVTLVDISELRHLEAQTMHLASFPEVNPNPVLEVDTSGRVKYCNPAARLILTKLGMDGSDCSPLIPPDLAAIMAEWDQKNEAVLPRELVIGDRVFNQTVHLTPRFKVARIYAHDITARKHAEEAAQRAKDEWERTFDSVPDLIAIMDDKHRVVRANRAMAERLGTTTTQCVDSLCFSCVHDTDQPPDFCPHARSLEDGRVHTAESYLERLGGYFLITTVPLLDGHGAITGSVHVARDITERKRAEQALTESEARVRRKLDSILSPEGNIDELDLADIIDTRSLQSLVDDFYKLTRMPMGLIDIKGKVLVGVGWQDICTKFHRVNPETCKNCIESDVQLSAGIAPGNYKIYRCKNNLWDVATPIIVGDRQFGNLFMGQFFFENEPLDYGLFRSQARQYGFDEKDYIDALESVPRLSVDMLDTSMSFFMKLADILSKLGFSNLKLARSLSERDTLMESLRQSEESLKSAQEIAHLGSWDLDLVNNRLRWSDEVYRIFGLHPQEFGASYEAFLEAVHPDDRAAVDAAYSASLHEGQDSYEIEHRVVSKATGEVRTVHEKCEHFRDASGRVVRSLGMVHDITERKRAEETLRANEAQFRTLADAIPQLCWMANADGGIFWYNRRWYDYTGTTPGQMEGWGWQSVHDPGILPVVLERWTATIATGMPFEMVFPLRGADGVFRSFLTRVVPVCDQNGKVVRWFGTNTDISDQLRTERALRERNQRLDILAETASGLLTCDSPRKVIESLCQKVMAALDCQAFFNFLVDKSERRLHLNACAGIPEEEKQKIEWLDFGVAVCGCAARDACRIVSEDIATTADPRTELVESYGIQAYACHPLMVEGEVLGTLSFGTRTRSHFSDDDLSLMKTVADHVAIAMDRMQSAQALQKANDELELRVAERTEELASAINVLQEEIVGREKAEERIRRLNRLYAVLSETNQAIVRSSERDSLFHDFCRIAVEHGGFLLSWVGLVNEENGQLEKAAASGAIPYLEDIRITAGDEPAGDGPTGIAIRQGTYCICNDFQNDPRTRPWHERGKSYGIRASASIALKQGGRVVGALTLYANTMDFFDEQQVELLLQVGADISFALDNLEREARRRDAETALQKETMERLQTLEVLRSKEQMLIQQSRLAAMGEMIGNIAHQWRQPLNALGLTIQQLEVAYDCGGFNKEQFDASVARAMEIVYHMSQTIDDFRNFYRPDKEKSRFALKQLLRKTVSLVEANFREDRIDIEITGNEDTEINGYPNEYAQVLLNILMNARDAFLERQPENRRITVRHLELGGKSVVSVTDNAGGIPEEIMDRIFDPYFTTKAQGLGTGVGLFMSKTIIEKNMGGRLTAANVDGGAEFRIEV